ncbi:hypothetical protein [Cesiribacter sp. SM1]|uniref:DUF7738 domain-containing protein n=1 Tax=Cesiribacter sp. SM1 TaxID=2861196 RepID=UPI001CD3D14C|nr:hypothetical protein [Cesiribacter sp. SM1]
MMKRYFLLLCLAIMLGQFSARAQAPLKVNVDLVKSTITIGNVLFTASSTIEDYEKLLGKADRIEQKRGIDQYFVYDKLGISLSLLDDDSGIVSEIFFTYLYDGDIKIAKEVYKGTLAVNNQVVSGRTTHQEMAKLAKIELVEVMNGYFITPKRSLNILMYYPEGSYKELKQYAFSFASAK